MHQVFHNIINTSFHFNWKFAVFVVILTPVFIKAGFWQLDRAQEKLERQQALKASRALPYAPLKTIMNDKMTPYQKVYAIAEAIPEGYLLDNQIHHNRFGYEVIQPFQLDDMRILFVSRGWLEGNLDRRLLPKPELIEGKLQLAGYLYPINKNPWLTAKTPLHNTPVIPSLYPMLLQDIFGQSPIPFVLRLSSPEHYIFERHWKENTRISPNKHKGYAFQWFAIALVLWIIFFWQSMEKK